MLSPEEVQSVFLESTMGNSRKYPYTMMDGFNILTPLAFRNCKMHYPRAPRIP